MRIRLPHPVRLIPALVKLSWGSSLLLLVLLFLLPGFAFGGEKVYFYHTDPAGTPLAMTDANGAVVWRADYKPFGEEQAITGTLESDERFAGKKKDKETGLNYFGARYVKTEVGRFISPDPVGPVDPRSSKINHVLLSNPQNLNPYIYSLNNPYKYIDPNGAFSVEIHRIMTIDVLSGSGFSTKAAQRVAEGNAYVDRLSNQGANYQHSMRNIRQSRSDATHESYQFSRQQLIEAGKMMTKGDYRSGLFLLGEGLHTVQDRKHNWITLLEHGIEEFRTDSNPTIQQRARALSDTQQYLNDFWSVLRNDLRLSNDQISEIQTKIKEYK
ncbi:MAG: RHS repeat-associated core domain-containing protein [Nitrospirota bacterium]